MCALIYSKILQKYFSIYEELSERGSKIYIRFHLKFLFFFDFIET